MSQAPSGFDPAVFLHAQQSEVNTKRPPLPVANPASADGFYTAIIGEVKTASGSIDKGERVGEPWLQMIIPLTIEVPQQVQDAMKLKLEKGTITLTDRAFIDLLPGGKGIDNSTGRNLRQKMYREALDKNKPGDVFAWAAAQGQVVKVAIEHEMYNGEPVDRIARVVRR